MTLAHDLVVAPTWKDVLDAPDHAEQFPTEARFDVSIDDLVLLLATIRGRADDRETRIAARHALHRGVHGHRFDPATRKVFVLGLDAVDEVTRLDGEELESVLQRWVELDDVSVERPEEGLAALRRAGALAAESSQSLFLLAYDVENDFEAAVKGQPEWQEEFGPSVQSWDSVRRFNAHAMFRALRRLGVDLDVVPAVFGELEHGGGDATLLAFLGSVRGSIQAVVDDGVVAEEDEDAVAVDRFNESLSETDRKRVVAAVATEVLRAIATCIEEGDTGDSPSDGDSPASTRRGDRSNGSARRSTDTSRTSGCAPCCSGEHPGQTGDATTKRPSREAVRVLATMFVVVRVIASRSFVGSLHGGELRNSAIGAAGFNPVDMGHAHKPGISNVIPGPPVNRHRSRFPLHRALEMPGLYSAPLSCRRGACPSCAGRHNVAHSTSNPTKIERNPPWRTNGPSCS